LQRVAEKAGAHAPAFSFPGLPRPGLVLPIDPATSNLDTESEQLIQESMATLLAGRTTFVIAHRPSTVRRADSFLLLAHGRSPNVGCTRS
jgi:ABC-type transport system involved in Fe-S cluster assembly fused permease/ATPase subunit